MSDNIAQSEAQSPDCKNSGAASCYTNYSHKRLFPENPTFKEAQAVSSVKGMREAISCHRLHSPMVRQAFDLARSQELSEDDAMVILAFNAVSQYENIQGKLLNELHRSPVQCIIKHGV